MLVTMQEEIKLFLPTSVQDSAASILTLCEDAEETYLLPILGRPLFDEINRIYTEDIVADGDWLLPQNGADKPIEQRLVRLCQEVVVSMVLANNAGMFSVSLNDAGINTPSAAGYDEADEKRIDRFVKDAFKKGHRAIDRLLMLLEEDATNDKTDPETGEALGQHFTDLWRKSQYFYQEGSTLFTTASQFDRCVSIDGSREWFVKLIPDIRFCQDNYIAPRVGNKLLRALVRSLTDTTIIPEGKADTWHEAIDRLRTALALYTENRNRKLARKESRQDADLSMERTLEFMAECQADFGEYAKTSPFYREQAGPAHREGPVSAGIKGDSSSTVHTLFSTLHFDNRK